MYVNLNLYFLFESYENSFISSLEEKKKTIIHYKYEFSVYFSVKFVPR